MKKNVEKLCKLMGAIEKKRKAEDYEKAPEKVRKENDEKYGQYVKEKEELEKCIADISKL